MARGSSGGQNGAQITWDNGELVARLNRMDANIDRAIAGAMLHHSQQAVQFMRQNAPWTDRTTNARNGLFAKVDRLGQGRYTMTIGHSVPYGLWLEVRFAGRYAILRPTLDHEGPLLMSTIQDIFTYL